MACVLNNLPIDTEKVKQWLTDNCEKVVSTTEAVNEALAMVNLHHGSAKAIPVSGGGMYYGAQYMLATDAGAMGNPSMASALREKIGDLGSGMPDAITIKDQSSMHAAFETFLAEKDFAGKTQKLSKAIGTALGGWFVKTNRNNVLSSVYGKPGLVTGATLAEAKSSFDNYETNLKNLKWNLEILERLAEDYHKLVQEFGMAALDAKSKIEAEILACRRGQTGQWYSWVKFSNTLVASEEECTTPEQKAKLKDLNAKIATALEEVAKPGAGLGAAIAGSQEPTKRTFKEQCLLLSNIVHFVEYRDKNIWPYEKKRLPYLEYASADNSGGGPVDNIPDSASITANASLLASRQPWGFINQLIQDPKFANLFGIKPHLLSQLQPMIRLYKVTSYAEGEEIETEINFDSVYNPALDGVLNSTQKRGFGVGIQNFVFSYEGSDPFAVKKSIKAKLSIFASSMDDLIRPRPGSAGSPAYRYADLALKTGSKTFSKGTGKACGDRSEIAPNKTADLNYRLKAVVGWSIPGSFKGVTAHDAGIIHDAINNSYVTLNLSPTIHEFEINDMGHVVFHINYLAYSEQFFDETSFNIFSNSETHKSAFIRRNKYKALRADCGEGEKTTEKLKELQEKDAEAIDLEKRASLNGILQKLLEREQVYMKPIPIEALRAFNSQGPYWKFDLFSEVPGAGGETKIADKDKVTTETEEIVDDNQTGKKKPEKQGEDLTKTKVSDVNQKEYISFFYLSDLVDVVLENIDSTLQVLSKESLKDKPAEIEQPAWDDLVKAEKERLKRVYYNFQKFRVVLGPMELLDTVTREYYETTIGDLPISTAYFMDWLTDKTLKQNSTVYSLPIFLKDLMNNLVKNFLNEDRCFDLNIKQRVRVFQSTITSYKSPGWGKLKKKKNIDEITEWTYQQGGGPRLDMTKMPTDKGGHSNTPVLHVMGERNLPINSRGPEHTYNYMVFYAGRVQPQALMNGIASEDVGAGVFHYVLGRDNGLIKTIKLNKTDSPGLKEVRFEQEGYDGLSQLREVYDANITCYGMPNIVPGTYIYIDPRGFAPDSTAFAGHLDADGNAIDNASLTRLGIGGYYMVTHAENKFGPGNCETEITAKWVAAISCTRSNATITGPGKRRPAKCGT